MGGEFGYFFDRFRFIIFKIDCFDGCCCFKYFFNFHPDPEGLGKMNPF